MAKIFTVVDASTNSKQSFETEATTVGQLLADFDAHNISYTGKTIFEGLTKSEFDVNRPEGILPHDVDYKGQTTSNLVFMLTTPNKKIASGVMNRAEAYIMVKKFNLGEAIKARFGRNYTNVPSDLLIEFVLSAMPSDVHVEEQPATEDDAEPITAKDLLIGCVITALKANVYTMDELMIALHNAGFVDITPAGSDFDADKKAAPKKPEVKCPYSDDDLKNMF